MLQRVVWLLFGKPGQLSGSRYEALKGLVRQ